MSRRGSPAEGPAAGPSEDDVRHPSPPRDVRDIVRAESRGYDAAAPGRVLPRADYLSWDDYFTAVAHLSALRSKDPHPGRGARHGACIVDATDRIVGIGYDGFPRGCPDDCLPWAAPGEGTAWLASKEPWLCAAEINAVLNKVAADVAGGRMYVVHFPSNEAAKFIVQAGIREVLYVRDDRPDAEASRASRLLLRAAGVALTRTTPVAPSLVLDFGVSAAPAAAAAGPAPRDEGAMERHLGLLSREAGLDPFAYPARKRADRLAWDDYFMGVAFLSARRSKDPSTQVWACIVDPDRRIVGIGYNGFPRGIPDAALPWARSHDDPLHTKYPYVVHAEVNAILNKCGASVRGATIFVALFPCHECAKVIIQSGIRAVVYLLDKYHDTDSCRASRTMFKMAGVEFRQHRPERQKIVLDF